MYRNVLLAICLAMFRPLSLWASNDALILIDKVIATVDQEVILHSELVEQCQMHGLCMGQVDDAKQMALLAKLVQHKMVLAHAALTGISVSKQDIQKEYKQYMAILLKKFGTQENISAYYKQPFYLIRKKIKRFCKESALFSTVLQKLIADVVVMPAEVCAYFKQLADQPYCPSEAEVYQLVVYPSIDASRQAMAKDKLSLFKQQIKDGKTTFLGLVEKYAQSQEPYITSKAEEWVEFGVGKPAYEAAILSMSRGQISEPVLVGDTFYLIALLDRDKQKYKTCHIAYTLTPTAQEMQLAEQKLAAIRQDIIKGVLSFEQAVKQYSEDDYSRSIGGLITYSEPSRGMASPMQAVEKLDPEVYFAIHNLKAGAITDPKLIKHNKVGWRLLYLKQKIEAHPMNLTQDYEKLYQQLLIQKQDAKIEKWLKTMQSCFVIEFSKEYQQVAHLL